ncbi:MAG: amidohydrolase [Myxococcota bacterium]
MQRRRAPAPSALALALALALGPVGHAGVAAASEIAFVGARVLTVSHGAIDPGTVVVRDGRIAAVGPQAGVEVPAEARVHDLSGRVLIPGLVDTHSHIGIYPRPLVPAHLDGNDPSKAVQPQLRALDAIWPQDPGIAMARAGGITTANIMPGSGSVVSGQTAYVKLRGRSVEQMLVQEDGVQGGLKMANGENPKRALGAKGKPPMTRMAIAALQRDLFHRAQVYLDKWARHEEKQAAGEDSEPPVRDLELEPVVEVLEGERIVHHHTHRSDDILSVLRLQREFGFPLVIQHGTEADRVIDEIREAGVPVSAIVLDSPGGKLEVADYRADYVASLERAGIEVAIHTDDFVTDSRLFLRSGALAVRAGMSEPGALRALTLAGARMLRLDDRVGSIEVGKDADLVVLSGPPFRVDTRVLETWIEGERVFSFADPDQRSWATGGWPHGVVPPAAAGAGQGR